MSLTHTWLGPWAWAVRPGGWRRWARHARSAWCRAQSGADTYPGALRLSSTGQCVCGCGAGCRRVAPASSSDCHRRRDARHARCGSSRSVAHRHERGHSVPPLSSDRSLAGSRRVPRTTRPGMFVLHGFDAFVTGRGTSERIERSETACRRQPEGRARRCPAIPALLNMSRCSRTRANSARSARFCQRPPALPCVQAISLRSVRLPDPPAAARPRHRSAASTP